MVKSSSISLIRSFLVFDPKAGNPLNLPLNGIPRLRTPSAVSWEAITVIFTYQSLKLTLLLEPPFNGVR